MAITSVMLACVAVILEKFIAAEWVFRVLSVAGIAAGLGLGQCIRAMVYGRLPAWWLPIASGLLLIVLLGMTGSALAGTAKSINPDILDRTFLKVVMFDFEDAVDELETARGKEASSVYYLGSNGTHTYFHKAQDGSWSTQIVRDSDIKTIRFRSLRF